MFAKTFRRDRVKVIVRKCTNCGIEYIVNPVSAAYHSKKCKYLPYYKKWK